MNLYGYIESTKNLNMIIITSIPVISIILYRLSKNVSLLIISILYLLELCIFVPILKNSPEQAQILSNTSYSLYIYIINISISVIIIKLFIVKEIKFLTIDLDKNKNKLKVNKKYLVKSINQISKECELQNKYKNEILYLNDKIGKSIGEVNMPIFVLNFNKEYIYSNKSFLRIVNGDGNLLKNFDVIRYIKENFINGIEAANLIKSSSSLGRNSITLKSHDDTVYRFICIADTIEDKGVIFCILNDITESTIIKNKLKESEEKYRNLMDILTDGVIIHKRHTVSYINDKARELFNIDKDTGEELLMDDINLHMSKGYRSSFLENINTIALGTCEKTTTKLKTKYGKKLEFITTQLEMNNEKMMLSLVIDVTDLENAVDQLEESEKTYKLLIQTLPEGIMIIEKNTKNHIYRNKAMIKILKDIGVETLNDFVREYISKKEYGTFKKFSVESNKELNISIAIIYMREEGNYLVVVRTLQNEKQAKKMAEKLSEVKAKYRFNTEFLTNVTKDLKKPINTICTVNNMLEINKDKYNSSNIDNYTRLVRQNCYRLIRLLNNIEEIDKVDSGLHKMDIKKYNLISMVESILNLARNYTNEKNIDIKFKSNLKEIFLNIDKDKIESIILNLLSNSIKFTDPGGKIEVSINYINKNIVLTVKDTGVGIPENKIGMIFENFEQIDRTLSRGAEGTGIGLSVVKKLVQAHDAKINVKSEVGVGSEFEVIFKSEESKREIDDYKDVEYAFADKEKMDIEFSDIYFNLSY